MTLSHLMLISRHKGVQFHSYLSCNEYWEKLTQSLIIVIKCNKNNRNFIKAALIVLLNLISTPTHTSRSFEQRNYYFLFFFCTLFINNQSSSLWFKFKNRRLIVTRLLPPWSDIKCARLTYQYLLRCCETCARHSW